MNTQNGFWSYFWSAITGFFAMLTLQDVLFALGFLITGIFTWLTYRSNNRRNLTAEEEERKRTKISVDVPAPPQTALATARPTVTKDGSSISAD
ncbi:hypothetical protein [Leclercia adecarboxylata]|uniref:hypothetical protein n=1 Tax=Leclercia adecarboxylata TaxID=83655 RepID=UPI00254E96DB|nr:hypothetical protein [Leclercia adecarboxylata]